MCGERIARRHGHAQTPHVTVLNAHPTRPIRNRSHVIRAIIVDDEPLARRGIRARLGRVEGYTIVAECTSGRDAVAAIREHSPDVVFLDVQMPGVDGFGVIREIGADRMPVVIFVTAYDTHALRAFEAHALDYLLKPIDDDRFAAAVARARRRVAERDESAVARRLVALMQEVGAAVDTTHATQAGRTERIVVRDRDRVLLIDVADVDWVGADGDYVRIHAGGKSHLLRDTMAAMEERLDPTAFVRIHRSAIVKVDRIRELRPCSSREYSVILRDGTRLRLSRRYRDRLRTRLGGEL